ncbi:hypothetical protein, partial [Corynebacterium parakroppenstedtii]|uniref:hypothetical protein n=1 Tax=Corynebacterium parakroppenstedtii TaxID=2828363 RepID=UPI001F3713A2
LMNIEILEERYAVDRVIEKAKSMHKDNEGMTFKCKDCNTGGMTIDTIIKHLKLCKERTDNLGYRTFKTKIKKINREELEEIIYVASQKELELMESTSSPSATPFQRTTTQHTVDNSTGNLPRRKVYRVDPTTEIRPENVKPVGKRYPIEEPIKLQEGGNTGKILNIAAQDPQLWNPTLDIWKSIVVADFIKNFTETDAETMYRYMETFLGESAK